MIAEPTAEGVVVWVVGYAMFVTLGGWLTLLGYRIRSRVLRPEQTLWGYFALAGFSSVLLGVLGIAWLVAGFDPTLYGAAVAVHLGFVVLCALIMREAYYNERLSNSEYDRIGQFRLRRSLEFGFVLAVLVVGIGPLAARAGATGPVDHSGFHTFAGVVALVVVAYGSYFHRKRTGEAGSRGTVIDTLLRHLFPVLTFAGGGLLTTLLPFVSIDPVIADALTGVLLVMAATSLVPLLVKFRQHLSVHR